MMTQSLFKSHCLLSRKGYKVVSVPFYLWEPLFVFQKHHGYIKYMFRNLLII